MNNVSEIKCFIASPSDTGEERDACEKVFEDINNGIGKLKGIRFSSLRWENDVYPSVGAYGQDVINTQMDGKYDLFIGIMKTRFGTPTPNAGSGTEEEFDIAYEKYKNGEISNIFFYFGNPKLPIDKIDLSQLSKVLCFKKKLEENGVMYMTYNDVSNFEERLKRDIENYVINNQPYKKKIKKGLDIVNLRAKSQIYEYRKLWEELNELIYKKKSLSNSIKKIIKLKKEIRFSKIIFPQENVINQLMTKELLSAEKANLFAWAVLDIGQLPSYYRNYHNDDAELNKLPIWIQLKEREKTLCGSSDVINDRSSDWNIYEQIQRHLFHLDFTHAKQLIEIWQAKDFWIQAKVMRMAVYSEYQDEARVLLDNAIKKEKNPSEKLFEVILANYISRQWPNPYSMDEFWKYGLDGQGDFLVSMMSSLRGKEEKPKRRGWVGSIMSFGGGNEDYVKSLRILQFIIDSGIYLAIPGSYIFDIASWYKVFFNLYEHFPYPCFFYSIQYNDRDVQRRIGEDFTYNEDLQEFVNDILKKSLNAIGNRNTPFSFKRGILNITAAMYAAVDEDEWFIPFKETVFRDLLEGLRDIQDSDDLVFNAKSAFVNIRKQENVNDIFQQLMELFSINEKVVSGLIVNGLSINLITSEFKLEDIFIFRDILSIEALDLLDVFNKNNMISNNCREKICKTIIDTPTDKIPHNRVALFQLINLTRCNEAAFIKIKEIFLSMNIWHCGVLSEEEWGWAEPMYIRLNLLNNTITWNDNEFEIIKKNLILNVGVYDKIHHKLHKNSFMKSVQVRYLSDMLAYIRGLSEVRRSELSEVYINIEKLLADRLQYASNVDLLMSKQSFDVDYACSNICEGVKNYGIERYRNDIDFLIDRAIMKIPIALTDNIRYISFLIKQNINEFLKLGYEDKIIKLLSVFKDSETWVLLDLHFAFNYLYSIAQMMQDVVDSNDEINFWIDNPFVKKFVRKLL
ncbi:hypothetical protein [uncultured Bacteroides sp.]|uniref:hypothetical protein n=1 Tax=uncultured Bacteroides sp. TaxID=162156 RepID=UPI00280B23A1|nr:hypothetical protein [uncultured Bacteroides sp.]